MIAPEMSVVGTGLVCASGTTPAELLSGVLDGGAGGLDPLASARSTLDGLGRLKWRRYMGPEAELLVAAGTAAAAPVRDDVGLKPASVGIVCATGSAGLDEYVQMYRSARSGTDRAANLVRGPQSSFNSPASHLSLHLGTQGVCMTLVGDGTSGFAAVKQARLMLVAGRVETVLAAGVDRSALTRSAEPGRVPGQAAAAVALAGPSTRRRVLARLRLVADRLSAEQPDWLFAAAGSSVVLDEVDAVVVTDRRIADLVGEEISVAHRDIPVLVTEHATGVVGAAGGIAAVIAAIEWLKTHSGGTVLSISGDAPGNLTAALVR
ncbi:hypothetical protein K1X22_26790 [Mycolicibacterium farcinogenes]|uniref:beta-ketoacyl synthase N-terminal-like domain-containing protein n=1 Tax=Mycolicibacterium farcinogenes TaxID=1802 RepID=UPI001C8D42AB|nr:beta-ketoacyl synthase N-terminal-like domain-containing protein [Mycolicibacterium farcinogenes]QZH59717.1 hypothetical protein K1X22_26790 [Mycolicibacterium farcinogenes]